MGFVKKHIEARLSWIQENLFSIEEDIKLQNDKLVRLYRNRDNLIKEEEELKQFLSNS